MGSGDRRGRRCGRDPHLREDEMIPAAPPNGRLPQIPVRNMTRRGRRIESRSEGTVLVPLRGWGVFGRSVGGRGEKGRETFRDPTFRYHLDNARRGHRSSFRCLVVRRRILVRRTTSFRCPLLHVTRSTLGRPEDSRYLPFFR